MPTTNRKAASFLARWCICLLAALWLAGCSTTPEKPKKPKTVPTTGMSIPTNINTVIPEGSVLIAHTAAGKIKIEAGPGTIRIFNWESARRGVVTKPRDLPFPGTTDLGLHFSGKPKIWKPYQGIDKVYYEENTRSFEAPVDLKIWTQIRRLYFAYNDNGLAVAWKRAGDTLHVEVWQFLIDGQVPDNLPGANDSAITLKTQTELKSVANADS